MKIMTNNHLRPVIYFHELTEAEQEEQDRECESGYFRYKGRLYSLDEFMTTRGMPSLADWSGYAPDSYFSGTLVKINDDNNEFVVAGWYMD